MNWRTCRFCGNGEIGPGAAKLFKYGVRHYAHAQCGLSRFGVGFLDRIPAHMLGELPFRVIKDAGLEAEVVRRINEAA